MTKGATGVPHFLAEFVLAPGGLSASLVAGILLLVRKNGLMMRLGVGVYPEYFCKFETYGASLKFGPFVGVGLVRDVGCWSSLPWIGEAVSS